MMDGGRKIAKSRGGIVKVEDHTMNGGIDYLDKDKSPYKLFKPYIRGRRQPYQPKIGRMRRI